MATQYQFGIRLAVDGEQTVVDATGKAGRGFEDMGKEADKTTRLTDGLIGKLGALATAYVGVHTIREFVSVADTMGLLEGRLRNAIGATGDYKQAQEAIYAIAQKNNIEIEAATGLYIRLAEPVQRMGGTTKEVAGIVEAFSTSLRIGGANTQEAAAATLQFAQAMGSGKLQGDEFRSLAEASPRFMQVLADGMDVPIGKLKDMGTEGQLTADVVGDALLKALGALRTEAETLPDTVGGAFTRMQNDAKLAVDEINKASGINEGIAGAIDQVRELIPAVRDELVAAFTSVGDWIKANKDEIGLTWESVKSLGTEVWNVVSAAGALLGGITGVILETGALRIAIDSVRLIVAGVRDGVDIVSAAFAGVGSSILQFVVTPLTTALTGASLIVGLFNDTLAAQLRSFATDTLSIAKSGQQYADGVFQKFADGKSRVGELNTKMADAKTKADQMRDALKLAGGSVAETGAESRRLAGKVGESGAAYAKLKGNLEDDVKAKKGSEESAKKLRDEEKLVAGQLLELAGFSKDYGDKVIALNKLYQNGKIDAEAYTKAHDDLIAKQPAIKERADFHAALIAEQNRLHQQAKIDADNYALAVEKANLDAATSAEKSRDKAKEEFDQYGLTKSAIAELGLERLADKLKAYEVGDANYLAVQREITAQQGLVEVLKRGEAREASVAAAKASADEWSKTADDIGRGLTDSLFRAFESGKSFFSTLWDGIKNTIKATVLKIGIDVVTNFVKGAVNTVIGGVLGTTGGTASAGGIVNTAGSLGSAYSAAQTGYSWLTGGAAAGATATGLGATGSYSMIGGALTETGVGSTLATTLGTTGSSAMSAIGAAAPYIAAAIAIYAIAKSLEGGETRQGGQYQYGQTPLGDGRSGFLSGPSGGQIAGDQVQSAIGATVASINQLLKDAGSAAELKGFQAALESSNNGRGGVYSGGTLSTGATFGELGLGGGRSNYNGTLYEKTSSQTVDSKTALDNFSVDLLQAQIQALQAVTDLPENIASIVRGVDAEALTAAQASEVIGKVAAVIQEKKDAEKAAADAAAAAAAATEAAASAAAATEVSTSVWSNSVMSGITPKQYDDGVAGTVAAIRETGKGFDDGLVDLRKEVVEFHADAAKAADALLRAQMDAAAVVESAKASARAIEAQALNAQLQLASEVTLLRADMAAFAANNGIENTSMVMILKSMERLLTRVTGGQDNPGDALSVRVLA